MRPPRPGAPGAPAGAPFSSPPAARARRPAAAPLGALGALCGALFLAEYSAGALVLVAAAGAARRFGGASRWLSMGLVACGFALVTAPWVVRNMAVTGLPVGLAVQNIALKAGDTTAEP